MHQVRLLLTIVLSVCLLAPAGAQFRAAPPPYRILISNDDGVRAPGLAAVAQTLQAIGQIHIVAPSENQSGKGHSIVTSEPVFREDLKLPNGLAAIGLTATPASSVNIAIRNIVKPRPDLVVSGINSVYNLGYSGYLRDRGRRARSRDARGSRHCRVDRRSRSAQRVRERCGGGARRGAPREAVGAAAEHVPQRERAANAPGRIQGVSGDRSEERRVGKECRA